MQCDSLIGKTVGLFGFGQIARKVATFLCGFPVTLLACDLNWPDTDTLPQVQRVELAELLEKSDVISLHIPLNQDTSAIVDARFLARMKKGACLINTARGGLVSEADLVEALQSGQLGGAGLDTFAAEPLPQSSPLLRLDNVVLTPHCASNTEQAFRQILGCCLDNVIDFRSGQGEAHIQNPDYARFLT